MTTPVPPICLISSNSYFTRSIMRYTDMAGYFVKPRAYYRNNLMSWCPIFGVENDAFNAFDADAFVQMLEYIVRYRDRCAFVPAPDVVGDHEETIKMFHQWQPRISDMGLPVAFVTQDGSTVDNVPWGVIQSVFIGGTDRHKDRESRDIIIEAKRRGMWVHIGRVNTRRRFRYCAEMKVDSFDGSSFDKFSIEKLSQLYVWRNEFTHQGRLL